MDIIRQQNVDLAVVIKTVDQLRVAPLDLREITTGLCKRTHLAFYWRHYSHHPLLTKKTTGPTALHSLSKEFKWTVQGQKLRYMTIYKPTAFSTTFQSGFRCFQLQSVIENYIMKLLVMDLRILSNIVRKCYRYIKELPFQYYCKHVKSNQIVL